MAVSLDPLARYNRRSEALKDSCRQLLADCARLMPQQANEIGSQAMIGHDAECMCPKCLMEDMDNFVAANGGTVYAAENVKAEKTRNLPAGQKVGNGYVRTISSRQVAFIKRLLSEKDITTLTLLPGQTIKDTEIPSMGVKGGSALIEKLLSLPNKPITHSVKVTDQGSDKQKAFLRSLMIQTNLTESDINDTYKTISAAISDMIIKAKSMPKVTNKSNTNEVTEGMYITEDGRIFKVQPSKAGNLYALELIDGSFEYVRGAITIVRNSARRMTLDEAKEYGRRTGTCCNCGRTLTNPESISQGIGPVCASRF